MSEFKKIKNAAVFVGSRHDQMCSVGAFARAEAKAFQEIFVNVDFIEPSHEIQYPDFSKIKSHPDVIFFHTPALSDRKTPWGAIENVIKIRIRFPKAKFISMIHEYTEAPLHWKIRQNIILAMSSAAIANTLSDYDLAKKYCRNILRSKLGPTLSFDELVTDPQSVPLTTKRKECIGFLRKTLEDSGNSPDVKVILHPGLVTHGKGVQTLKEIIPTVDSNAVLLMMGGIGPKQRDKDFAESVKKDLKEVLGKKFIFLENPNDETYARILNSASLVLLPYDVGLSERRSSFLSAMSCGANVFTTTGKYSMPMEAEKSGAYLVDSIQWNEKNSAVLSTLKKALDESESEQIKRRLHNLQWAQRHTWSRRARDVYEFVNKLDS